MTPLFLPLMEAPKYLGGPRRRLPQVVRFSVRVIRQFRVEQDVGGSRSWRELLDRSSGQHHGEGLDA